MALRDRLPRPSLVIALLTTGLLAATSTAQAYGINECAPSRKGSDLGCTAGDVSITGIALASSEPAWCVGGSSISVDLNVTVNFAVPDRWDVGIFLVNDGKDPLLTPANGGAATCSVAILPTSSPFLNLDPGPWGGVLDTCGDGNSSIGGGTGSGVLGISSVPVSCQAINLSGGNLYIPFVVSWDNQSSPSGNTCTSIADPVPNTVSKCNSPKTTVAAEVAYGTVNTVVLPAISKTDGIATIEAGASTTYSVVITNTTGVALSNAVFTDPAVTNLTANSVTCTAAGGATCPAAGVTTVANMQGAGITIPAMPVNGSVTFTINATVSASAPAGALTNTARVTAGPLGPTPPANRQTNTASDTNTVVRKPVITVRKQSNGGTGSFSFTGSNGVGSFSLDTSSSNPQSSTAYTATAANTLTTITETIPAGWTLSSASCSDGSATFGTLSGGTLTIAAGDMGYNKTITCTFTNDKKATITVNKVLSPPTATGTFNLLVGATTVAAAVGNGGTGNTEVSGGVAVTVSETAAGATSLADYDAAYSCSDGSAGTGTSVSLTPAAGQAISCTFTNTFRPGDITLVKMAHNLGSSGYDLPGETVRYTLVVTNFDNRPIDSGSIRLVDPIPANTALVAVDPVVTISNTPAVTGLTLTYGGLTDATDQVEFSTDGSNFNYQPTDSGNGTDPNVTHIRFRPTGSMNAASGSPEPSFQATFKVKIK